MHPLYLQSYLHYFMKLFSKLLFLLLLFVQGFCFTSISQEEGDETDKPGKLKAGKGFHVGITVGGFFANNAGAQIYDGYGLDGNGGKNDFANSYMLQKINQYGGFTSPFVDQIAQAMSVDGQIVNHDGWSFSESDMPIQMRYNPSILIGLACRYFVDKKNTLIFNVNATKIRANGAFTITLLNPIYSSQTFKTFSITGGEQRLMFQLGYQRILGNNAKANMFIEAGLNLTMAKFDKNQIAINNLVIDLFTYYNPNGQQTIALQKPVTVNLGAFAGLGLNITMTTKTTLQVLYAPVFERLKLGYDTGLQLHHSVALRAYYNF